MNWSEALLGSAIIGVFVYTLPFAHRNGYSTILLPESKSKWRWWDHLINAHAERIRIALSAAAFCITFLFYVNRVAGFAGATVYLPCVSLYAFILTRSVYFDVRKRK